MNETGSESTDTLHVLGIAGSLRSGSYNRWLLHAAAELAPDSMQIEAFGRLGDIPLYNADIDNEEQRPGTVAELKQRIEKADALLIVTPEYNFGIPGVLKNAIDWASRPAYKSVLANKPVAILGASPGAVGTARAQEHLKLVLLATLAYVLPHRPVLVGSAKQKFDSEGQLTDDATREILRGQLEALAAWTRRLAAGLG